VQFISGAVLRLRADIWERVKSILRLLGIKNGIEKYKNELYEFREPLISQANFNVNKSYEFYIIQNLKQQVLEKNIKFDFSDLFQRVSLPPTSNRTLNADGQTLLLNYI
jgi:hypothetical protein